MTDGIDASWVWAIGFIALACGLGCGVAIGYLLLGDNRRARELQVEFDKLQNEFDGYRGQVSQHFQQTSELIQKMTDSYREVYEHLASGSQELCQNPVTTPQLDFPEQPTLDAKTAEHKAVDDAVENTVPGTETDATDELASDDYLGDSPKVPTLEEEEATDGATLHKR